MKVCVFGLWHLGSVTAGCLASLGHEVVGLDFDERAVAGLTAGHAPLHEPGLDDLIGGGLAAGHLRFTTDPAEALRGAAVVWVTYDTPVNDDDEADVRFVTDKVEQLFPHLEHGAAMVVSSQLPVGSTRALADRFAAVADGRHCHFAYSPENLRLGKAIDVFSRPDRIVVGVDDAPAHDALAPLLTTITDNLLWTGLESAEMIKHAINAFLATSIVFANEIAAVCEGVGADAREVARGLKSEARIGPGAYVTPGGPFAGGTLARDIAFLTEIGQHRGAKLGLLGAVKPSNDWHRSWAQRRLGALIPRLSGATIAILGLTYKAGTDTLRRSAAVELAESLVEAGAKVTAYDPRLRTLPEGLASRLTLAASVDEALRDADAAVLTIDAPEFRAVDWPKALRSMATPVLVDAGGVARDMAAGVSGLRYATVGLTRTERPEHAA